MTKNESNLVTEQIDQINNTLTIAREQAKELERVVLEFENRLKQVQGTRDVTEQAKEARRVAQQDVQIQEERPADLRGRMEQALKRESLTPAQISRTTGESLGPVADMLKLMKQKDLVYNVGSQEYPLWTYRIGDNTSTPELMKTIRRLISERPMTTRELIDATGARMSRVSGAMVAMLRGKEFQILNMGHKRVARWFLVSDQVKAKLDQPQRRGKV